MIKPIISGMLVGVIIVTCGHLRQQNRDSKRQLVTGVVTEVGSCAGDEGFFSGNYECKVAVQVGNTTEYWTIYGKAIRGQSVSRKCWKEIQSDITKHFCGVGE